MNCYCYCELAVESEVYFVELRHCSKLQNVMMYPVQLVDMFSDTFRPLIEAAINVSTELDEIVAGQPVKGYVQLTAVCLSVCLLITLSWMWSAEWTVSQIDMMSINPLMPTVAIWYSYKASCARPG